MSRITTDLIKRKSEHNEGIMGDLEEISLHQVIYYYLYEMREFGITTDARTKNTHHHRSHQEIDDRTIVLYDGL